MSNLIKALRLKLEGEVAVARANIEVYMTSSVGIGEHPQFAKEIDKQLEIIGCASDKLKVIEKYFDEEIPF